MLVIETEVTGGRPVEKEPVGEKVAMIETSEVAGGRLVEGGHHI